MATKELSDIMNTLQTEEVGNVELLAKKKNGDIVKVDGNTVAKAGDCAGTIDPMRILGSNSGINKFNYKLPHEGDVLYRYTDGTRVTGPSAQGYYAYKLYLQPGEYTWFGSPVIICNYKSNGDFIGSFVKGDANKLNFSVTSETAYTRISVSNGATAAVNCQINVGTARMLKNDYVDDFTPLYQKYFFPFIRNQELVCNQIQPNRTATYLIVERPTICKMVACSWKIKNDLKPLGTVALGIYSNYTNSPEDITNLSLHLTYNGSRLKLDILRDGYGPSGSMWYHNIIDVIVPIDRGAVEHSLRLEWNNEECSVNLDGVTYQGTNSSEMSLAQVCGNYAFVEHYVEGETMPANECDMPRFTYFGSKGGFTSVESKDYFAREDGLPVQSPQGFRYLLMSNDIRGRRI